MKNRIKKLIFSIGLLAIGSLFIFKKDINSQFTKVITNPLVPKTISFAGEKTPLSLGTPPL